MNNYLPRDKLVRFQLLPQAKLNATSAINFTTLIQITTEDQSSVH